MTEPLNQRKETNMKKNIRLDNTAPTALYLSGKEVY